MLVTAAGIVMLVKPEQPLNALLPILVTELGIVTLVKPEQFWNALEPMLVTLYVTSSTTKDDKIVTAPVAEPELETEATPEPTT
jgi:hypothetical protein